MSAQRFIISYTNFTCTRTSTKYYNCPFLPRIKSPKPYSFRGFRSSCEIMSLVRSPNTRRRGSFLSSTFSGNCEDGGSGILEEEEGLVESSHGFRPHCSALKRVDHILNRMSKWLVISLFWVVIFWKLDATSLWAILGNFLNHRMSTTLKHILNQERPVPGLRIDPGMPSSHAQSIFFTFLFAVMTLLKHVGANPFSLSASALAVSFASYLSWLRISHRLHTIRQAVVGAILGLSFCIFWFWWWEAIVQKAFSSLLWVRVLVISGVIVFCSIFVVFLIQSLFHVKSKLAKSN